MSTDWNSALKRLHDFHASRLELREVDGSTVEVYDRRGLRVTVYGYPVQRNPLRTPIELLSKLIRQIDALLRADGKKDEIGWLDAVLTEYTKLPLLRIDELTSGHFDLGDELLQRVGFDRLIWALVKRSGAWSITVPRGKSELLPQASRLLKPLEYMLIKPLIGANDRLLGKQLALKASRKHNSNTRTVLGGLVKDGFLDSKRSGDDTGYALIVDSASLACSRDT